MDVETFADDVGFADCPSCGSRSRLPERGPPVCYRCGYLRCPACDGAVHLALDGAGACLKCEAYIVGSAERFVDWRPPPREPHAPVDARTDGRADEQDPGSSGSPLARFFGMVIGFFGGIAWVMLVLSIAAGIGVLILFMIVKGMIS